MSSRALQDFETRLKDVQQLIDAHEALTRLRRAEGALQSGGQQLSNVATVVQHLVTDPGRGRRKEVHALNNAAIALLSGHLQGYLVDLFEESANALFVGPVQNVNAITATTKTRGNPNPQNIKNMFGSLGFEDIFQGVSWQKMSTPALKKKLQDFNTLRNRIVHGKDERVRKQVVVNYLSVWRNFAIRLDANLRSRTRDVTGAYPW